MSNENQPSKPEPRGGIGTLNEFSMHAQIIHHLAQPNDQLEAELEGYFIDILRGQKIIEVQTSNLAQLMPKIKKLRDQHPIEIIYPLKAKKYIIKKKEDGEIVSRRASPKKERIEHVFDQLVYAPEIIIHKNVSLTVLMIESEEVWLDDGEGSWRRKFWSISERNLTRILDKKHFEYNEDFLELLPKSLPSPFTNKQLAKQLRIRGRLAGKITYTFRKMGLIDIVDKKGNAYLFSTM
jgi:hypothetical protein